jgi:hypothetical protein
MDMEHIKVNNLFWLYSIYCLLGITGEQGMPIDWFDWYDIQKVNLMWDMTNNKIKWHALFTKHYKKCNT